MMYAYFFAKSTMVHAVERSLEASASGPMYTFSSYHLYIYLRNVKKHVHKLHIKKVQVQQAARF
jgi:hypothetical protein